MSSRKHEVIDAPHDIFVISDLHLGDRSAKDRFVLAGKEKVLNGFLDHVQREEGHLIIGGDLFELWRYPLEQVTDQWQDLLQRFQEMGALFIPGNHDATVADSEARKLHPFYESVTEPFTTQVGERRVRFMHGHELDPFQPRYVQNWGKHMGICASLFDLKDALLDLTNYALSDVLYDLGEHILRVWHLLAGNDRHSIHRDLCLPQEHAASYSLRVQKMLSRFLIHLEGSQYDLAVAGHTHKPGQFGRWYYNSGSWTRPANNFLKIWPDGHAQVFDWTQQGERANDTLIWDHPNCQQSRDAA